MASSQGRCRARVFDGKQDIMFAAAVIVEAIKEMRSEPAPSHYRLRGNPHQSNESRANATTWLGSKDARKWFDLSGVNQVFTLSHIGWVGYARTLLDTESTGPGDKMAEWESNLLKSGIEYFTASRHHGD